jgi:hypothetical protein
MEEKESMADFLCKLAGFEMVFKSQKLVPNREKQI